MGLLDFLKRKPRDEPKKDEPEKDTLLAVLYPRKAFLDKHYTDQRGLVTTIDEHYFDSCAMDMQQSLVNGYKAWFDGKKSFEEGKELEYQFSSRETVAKYAIKGTDRWTDGEGETWSNDIIAMFSIEAPRGTLNMDNAVAALKDAMTHHLLEYRDHSGGSFGVFYSSKDKDMPTAGRELLDKIGILPTEAAEFFSVMIYGGHRYVTFDERGNINRDPKTEGSYREQPVVKTP